MRFWIRDATDTIHDGINIQGNGGIIRDAARLRAAIRSATDGLSLPIVEPQPGHARGHYAKWWGSADERLVDLRGAELLRSSDEPLPNLPPPSGHNVPTTPALTGRAHGPMAQHQTSLEWIL
jgi:hypothetical protein